MPKSNPPATVRVLLADDHTLVRAGIRSLLGDIPGVEVVAEAGNGSEALELARQHLPDIVLMDIGMPRLNGLEATARLHREVPQVRVIILSMHQNEEYVWRALKAGASGYLLKKAATAELAAALQTVMRDEVYLSPGIPVRLREVPPPELLAQTNSLERLTPRQREILQLIAEGKNTKEIAFILEISTKTVEYHRVQLMDRLKIHDIPGLVRYALRRGMIVPES